MTSQRKVNVDTVFRDITFAPNSNIRIISTDMLENFSHENGVKHL